MQRQCNGVDGKGNWGGGGRRGGGYVIAVFVFLPDGAVSNLLLRLSLLPVAGALPPVLREAKSRSNLPRNADNIWHDLVLLLAVNVHPVRGAFSRELVLVADLHAHDGAFDEPGAGFGGEDGGEVDVVRQVN